MSPRNFYDEHGRAYSAEEIARDYLGRNRERAMTREGVRRDPRRERRPFEIAPELERASSPERPARVIVHGVDPSGAR